MRAKKRREQRPYPDSRVGNQLWTTTGGQISTQYNAVTAGKQEGKITTPKLSRYNKCIAKKRVG